jgi:YVTN family beta-propeller protein
MRPVPLLASALLAVAAPAAGQSGDLLLVANKQAATVTVIDVGTGRAVATLPVGVAPHEVAASPDGRWAVVSNYGERTPGSTLSVIDLDRLQVVRTIELGQYRRPHGIAFLGGAARVAVTSEASGKVVIVNVGEGRVEGAIPTGQAGSHMLAVSPDAKRVYTANIPSGTVSELDVEARTLVWISPPVAHMTEGIALTPDGRRLWVGSNTDHTVTVLDTRTLAALDTLPSAGFPYRAVASPDGRLVLVPSPMASLVRIFDAESHRELAAIPIPAAEGAPDSAEGSGPVGAAISPDSRTAYVALQGRNQVAVIDVATYRVTGFLDVGAGPDGITYARRH